MSTPMDASHVLTGIQPEVYTKLSEDQQKQIGKLGTLYVQVLSGGEGRNLQSVSALVRSINNFSTTLIRSMPSNADAAKLSKNLHELNARVINTLNADKGLLERTGGRVNQLVSQLKTTNEDIKSKAQIYESCPSTPSKGWFATAANIAYGVGAVTYSVGAAVVNTTIDVGKDALINKYVAPYTSMNYLTNSPNFSTMVDTLVTNNKPTDGVVGKVLEVTTLDKRAMRTIQSNITPSLQPARFHQLVGVALSTAANGAHALEHLREIAKPVIGERNVNEAVKEISSEKAGLSLQQSELEVEKEELLKMRASLGSKLDSARAPESKSASISDMKSMLKKVDSEYKKTDKKIEEMEAHALGGRNIESLSKEEKTAISNKLLSNPKYRELQANLSKLHFEKSDLSDLIGLHDKKAQENKQVKATVPKTLKEIDTALKKIDKKLEIIKEKSGQLENMREYLIGKRSAMPAELAQNAKTLKGDISKLKSQQRELSETATKLKAEIRGKLVDGKDINSHEIEHEKLKTEKEKLKTEYKNLKTDYENLKTEKKQTLKTNKYAQDQKKTSETENKSRGESLKAALQKNKDAQGVIKKQMKGLDKKIDEEKELINKAVSRRAESSPKGLSNRQEAVSKLQAELDEVDSQLKLTNTELKSKESLLVHNEKMVDMVKKNEELMTPVVEALTGRPNLTKEAYCKETQAKIMKNLKDLISDPTLSSSQSNLLTKAILQLPVTLGASIFGEKFISWGQSQVGALLGSMDATQSWLDVPTNEGGLTNAAMELVFLELTNNILQEMVDSAKLAKRPVSGMTAEQKQATDQTQTKEAQAKLNESFDEALDALDKLKKTDSNSFTGMATGIATSMLLQNVLKGTDVSGKIIEPLRQNFQNWLNAPSPFPIPYHGMAGENSRKLLTDAGIGKALWVKDSKSGLNIFLVRIQDDEGNVNLRKVRFEGDTFEDAIASANSELADDNIKLTKESFV